MFYSQFILAKKGPLGTIWIAAHLERKLRKNQVADTDIGVSVDSILFPDVPIALRLSSHLLLGVVRIYSRKVNYLFDDCSEALLKVKQAFRSTAVDLPPEESTAPYHSITLPETFDLDDFELPDNEIFQGNYVDHHVSTREQITLQDTMDGVVYSTSQFGLDERFGDGDTSQIGLDLDEELFIDRVTAAGNETVSDGHPQASVEATTAPSKDATNKWISETSETMLVDGNGNQIEGLAENSEFNEYAQAPPTPGLVEVTNLSSAQEALACDDHMETEDHNVTELVATERGQDATSELDFHQRDKSAMDWSFQNDLNHNSTECMPPDENDDPGKETNPGGDSLSNAATMEYTSVDGRVDESHVLDRVEHIHNRGMSSMNLIDGKGVESPCCSHVTSELEDPGRASNTPDVHNDTGAADIVKEPCSPEKALMSDEACLLDSPGRPTVIDGETQACQVPKDAENLNDSALHGETSFLHKHVLQPCNSHFSQADMLSPGGLEACSVETARSQDILHVSAASTEMQGEGCHLTDIIQLEGNQTSDSTLHGEIQGDGRKSDEQLDNMLASDNQLEMLNRSATYDLPAPEKLLSVPEGLADKPNDFLVESTPDKEVLPGADGVGGIQHISRKKRSFTESSLTVESLNSVESVGLTRSKRTAESIPDDDDLLSSILVGRGSSVLKMKPTPTLEAASTKRTRSAPRSTASKRKVLMDDTMVLHGDIIRQQLTNTEDIRRIRKKAPCTHPEISMIQRQFLEDEIFSEPIFTGMSVELVSLHCDTYDLSGTRISENDESHLSSEVVKDVECSVRPNVAQESGMEGSTEPVVLRNDVQAQPAENPIQTESQHIGYHDIDTRGKRNAIFDVDQVKSLQHDPLGEKSEMEINRGGMEVADEATHSTVQGMEISSPTVVAPGDICEMSAGEKTDVADTSLQPFGEKSEMEIDRGEMEVADEAIHSTVQELEISSPTGVVPGDICEMSAGEKTDVAHTSLQMDGSCKSADLKMDGQPVEKDASVVDIRNGKHSVENTVAVETDSKATDEFLLDENTVGASVEITDVQTDFSTSIDNASSSLVTASLEAGGSSNLAFVNGDQVVGVIGNNKVGVQITDLGNDNKDPTYDGVCSEEAKMNSIYSVEFDIGVKGASFNDGETQALEEVDPKSAMDAGIIAHDYPAVGDRAEFENVAVGNDTEFLNVDDADIAEEDDDGMPCGEETCLLENSGWSSRTRAVAKYLQTLFDKEAVHGRKVVLMDNLLAGKTSKEASRMFFETLVLKTKDYIHVEQANPFDNINIKPRAKLMKSDF